MNKYIINWELSLKCNLDCYFCSQKERRNKQKSFLSFEDIKKIINNLPNNSHISFLWWETLIFPKIKEIFTTLEEKNVTYEITTNWILLNQFLDTFKTLKKLKQINISLDWYWDFHDISRWKKWLFNEIIEVIPELLNITEISISTVITNNSEHNLVKLYKTLNNLWIKKHKLIYCMNFTKDDIKKSKEKIKDLHISSPGNSSIDNKLYKKQFLKSFLLLSKLNLNTNIFRKSSFLVVNRTVLWKTHPCEFHEYLFSLM